MPEDSPRFEELLKKLQAAVSALEDGSLTLDDALKHYEQGVALIARCRSLLDQAEQRVALLSGVDASGNLQTSEFTDLPAPTLGETSGKANDPVTDAENPRPARLKRPS